MRDRRRQLHSCLLLAAITATGTARAQAEWMAPVAAACGPARTLPLLLVNEAGADRAMIDVAMREAETIWALAGVRLVWTVGDATGESASVHGSFVMVRRRLTSLSPKAAFHRSARAQLGRVVFDRAGRPSRVVEVSLTEVVAAVARADRTAATGPIAFMRPELVGRALGRVVAHELGHWLFGRGHAADGLMRARLRLADLVSPRRPEIGAAWLAARAEPAQDFARCVVAGRTPPVP